MNIMIGGRAAALAVAAAVLTIGSGAYGQSDAQIKQRLIRQSIASYSGSCPCPYNVDRGGRRCGARSAYSRPGGRSPLCFASDISAAQVRAARGR
jgi:hypothetical protein